VKLVHLVGFIIKKVLRIGIHEDVTILLLFEATTTFYHCNIFIFTLGPVLVEEWKGEVYELTKKKYEVWNFNSGDYLFTTVTK